MSQQPRLRLIVCLGALSAVHFLSWLGSRSLWSPDEGRYAEIAREMVEGGDWITPRLNYVRYFEKPPLIYWMTAASFAVLGENEWTARLPVAVLGVLGVLVTYWLGELVAGRRAGVLAAAVLATCPAYYAMSRFLVLDMGLAVFVAAGLCLFYRGLTGSTPSPRCFIGAAAMLALAVLAKGPIGLVLPAMVLVPLAALPDHRRKLLALPWGRMLAVGAMVVVPWFAAMAAREPGFLRFFFVHEHLDRFLKPGHSRPGPVWYFVPVLVAGAFPWSCFLPAAARAGRAAGEHALFLWSWLLGPFLFFSISKSKLPSYILPIYPALAVLVALAFDRAMASAPGGRTGAPAASGAGPAGHPARAWLAGGCLAAAAVVAGLVHRAFTLSPAAYPDLIGIRNQVVGLLLMACAGAVMTCGLVLHRRVRTAFVAVAVATAATEWLAERAALRYEPQKDVKVISRAIQDVRRPGERVVIYGTLESASGVPFYIKGPVIVAGHHFGELTMARKSPRDGEARAFADPAIAELWMHPGQQRSLFVTSTVVFADYFLRHPALALREIRRHGDLVLFTNR
jgi:4-amino-4-deoxy-L-arabinose transferase-like glycosyltransferase